VTRKNKQNQTRQNSKQFQSRVSEYNSEERLLTPCRFCSVCKTCVLLQTAVKYIWHFQDHPLNTKRNRGGSNHSFFYSYQDVTEKNFKNPIALRFVRPIIYRIWLPRTCLVPSRALKALNYWNTVACLYMLPLHC